MMSGKIIVETKSIGNGTGVKIALPNANIILLVGSKGYVMCGYLNMETAERLGDAACLVTGVKEIEDALKAKIIKTTSRARDLGVGEGMSGEEALKLLS